MQSTYAKKSSTLRGFTIVELLIVIVVIAILAVISIATYINFQQRARNTTRLSASQAIYRQLQTYTVGTGKGYGSSVFCIPTEANYDAGDGGLLDCNHGANIRSEDATVNQNFRDFGLTFSYPDTIVKDSLGNTYRGIYVTYGNGNEGMDGVLRPYVLAFTLEGLNQNCGVNSVRWDTATDPLYKIVPAQYWYSGNGITRCYLSLPYHQ